MILFKKFYKKHNITFNQMIELRWKLVNDPSKPASVRNDIYKEFSDKLEEIEEAEKAWPPFKDNRNGDKKLQVATVVITEGEDLT